MASLSLLPDSTAQRALTFADWAPRGSVVELSGAGGCAHTSFAVSLLIHYQRRGEPVAWVQPQRGALYPPDLAQAGIDLESLLVVQIPSDRSVATSTARACELLLRSGAFGLVVADFMEDQTRA